MSCILIPLCFFTNVNIMCYESSALLSGSTEKMRSLTIDLSVVRARARNYWVSGFPRHPKMV